MIGDLRLAIEKIINQQSVIDNRKGEEMPYTIKEPPDWLKSLPDGAIKIGVEVFNNTFAAENDEDKARVAAWGAIKQEYEKGEDGEWRAKTDVSLDDIRNM